MDHKAALLRLAELFRIAARTIRDIGSMQRRDGPEIESISHRTEKVADDLEDIGKRPGRRNDA